MQQPAATRPPSFPQRLYRAVERIGEKGIHVGRYVYDWFVFLGGLVLLLIDTLRRAGRAQLPRKAKLGRHSLLAQMVRVGVRSVPTNVLLQIFIGIILALQLAPTMESYGQKEKIADIVAIAIFRELGPLISA